jgi:hypothetical protein
MALFASSEHGGFKNGFLVTLNVNIFIIGEELCTKFSSSSIFLSLTYFAFDLGTEFSFLHMVIV